MNVKLTEPWCGYAADACTCSVGTRCNSSGGTKQGQSEQRWPSARQHDRQVWTAVRHGARPVQASSHTVGQERKAHLRSPLTTA